MPRDNELQQARELTGNPPIQSESVVADMFAVFSKRTSLEVFPCVEAFLSSVEINPGTSITDAPHLHLVCISLTFTKPNLKDYIIES